MLTRDEEKALTLDFVEQIMSVIEYDANNCSIAALSSCLALIIAQISVAQDRSPELAVIHVDLIAAHLKQLVPTHYAEFTKQVKNGHTIH